MRKQVPIKRTKNMKPKKPTKNMITAITKKTRGNGLKMKNPVMASTNTALTVNGKRKIPRGRGHQSIGPKVRRDLGIMRATPLRVTRIAKSGCLNEQRTGKNRTTDPLVLEKVWVVKWLP